MCTVRMKSCICYTLLLRSYWFFVMPEQLLRRIINQNISNIFGFWCSQSLPFSNFTFCCRFVQVLFRTTIISKFTLSRSILISRASFIFENEPMDTWSLFQSWKFFFVQSKHSLRYTTFFFLLTADKFQYYHCYTSRTICSLLSFLLNCCVRGVLQCHGCLLNHLVLTFASNITKNRCEYFSWQTSHTRSQIHCTDSKRDQEPKYTHKIVIG